MRRRYGERAVTVQIGAILLLAIVFTALALYQVNAVPAENQAVESEHNQQVHGELQDLRNAVRNVGTGGGTRSVSITLGTSYPARTFLTNPPDPTGTLETTERANVTIANATYEGSADDYDGDPSNLTGRHETTTVAYHPDYNEYRTAPTTRIEHGFAFDEYDDAAVPVTEQGLLENGTIRLVVLEGSLSTTGRNTVSLDPTSVSGPSDEIPIRSDGGNITLTLPTQTPSVWNETIGASFEAGESNARIVGTGPESVRIELADDGDYALQLARVSIDGSGGADPRYDVQRADSDGEPTAESGQFDVNWDDGDSRDVAIAGDNSVSLAMRATDDTSSVTGASVSYAVSDPDGIVDDFDGSGTTDTSGRNETTLDLNADEVANDGSTVTVYTSSGGAGDVIRLNVVSKPFFTTTISNTNEPVTEGNDLEVDATIENTGAVADEQTVEFELVAEDRTTAVTETRTVQLDPGSSDTRTFQWGTSDGDAGEYTAIVSSENDSTTRTGLNVVTEKADVSIASVSGLEDGTDAETYIADVTVGEGNGVETENLTVGLEIRNSTGDVVYDGRVSSAEIAGETTTVNFNNIGTLEADQYTYTATANADNANDVTVTDGFSVSAGPQFQRLEAEVTDQRVGGPTSAEEAGEVTFGYELSADADDVVVTIEDQIGQEATTSGATAGGEFHAGQTVSFDSGGQPTDNYPVEITVDIVNGECRTAELEDFEDVASLEADDWQSC